ncbi:hypothetical protein SDC9_33544 [bioreactor metagenome]|uniref:Uncharacterized protein n=2 Tax=root TaxID=1 RepID=A0A098B167_DESHA|nr:Hypothetical protein DPCES_2210 [Desulfitobacterium hafniense]
MRSSDGVTTNRPSPPGGRNADKSNIMISGLIPKQSNNIQDGEVMLSKSVLEALRRHQMTSEGLKL